MRKHFVRIAVGMFRVELRRRQRIRVVWIQWNAPNRSWKTLETRFRAEKWLGSWFQLASAFCKNTSRTQLEEDLTKSGDKEQYSSEIMNVRRIKQNGKSSIPRSTKTFLEFSFSIGWLPMCEQFKLQNGHRMHATRTNIKMVKSKIEKDNQMRERTKTVQLKN